MNDNRIRRPRVVRLSGPASRPVVDSSRIPVYINNRDRVSTLKTLVDWLRSSGTLRIVILDNASTYPPLLEYYKALPSGVSVDFLGANLGPWAFWDKGMHLQQSTPYVVTDSDVVPDAGCPKDLIHKLNVLLNSRPESGKAGPGLRIDDVPEFYSMNGCDHNEQMQYWTRRYSPEAFFAAIDTTFALYPAHSNGRVDTLLPDGTFIQFSHDHLDNLRMDKPYIFRHAPWYAAPPLSEEELYYRTHCEKGWSHSIGTSVMPKVLVAIISCHKQRAWQQSQRDTWLKDLIGADYKFILGNPKVDEAQDELFLNVSDGYSENIHKTIGTLRWALDKGYDYVYKCDVDTLVNPKNLMSSGFEHHDYVGGLNTHFASGGAGYWLSDRAMRLVINTPDHGAPEDVFVSEVCREHCIPLHDDQRYKYYPGSILDKDTISYHISSTNGWPGDENTPKYDPSMMYSEYAKLKAL